MDQDAAPAAAASDDEEPEAALEPLAIEHDVQVTETTRDGQALPRACISA